MSRLIERQLRNWELARAQRYIDPMAAQREVEEFITISRQVGAGGAEVASLVSERLGWPLFDREILTVMAGDDDLRRRVYSSMDERDVGWLEETVRALLHPGYSRSEYFHRLTRTVLSLARQGKSIFLGRGADLILPPGLGLRVSIVAPEAQRLRAIMQTTGQSEEDARRELVRLEQDRREFLHGIARKEVEPESRFDLVISLARLTPAQAAAVILKARETRQTERAGT